MCLGHQVLCDRLGIPLAYKDIVFQGTQSPVDLFGRHEQRRLLQHVRRPQRRPTLPDGVAVAADPETGDVHLLAGPHYRGIQFHAESILTEHGFDLIRDLLLDLLATRRSA